MKNKNIINYIEYFHFRLFILIIRLLPYPIIKALLVSMFYIVGYWIGIRKKVALLQLRKVFPNKSKKEANRIIKGMYRQMALNVAEVYFMNDAQLNMQSKILGKEYIDEALSMQRGAILATAHFGNWEAARILPLRDIPVSVITKRQRNLLFDKYTNDIRERNGVRTIDMKRGLREIVHDLQENRLVAILADQNAGKSGLIKDFLGFPASHWKGVAKLSLRYKIPIIHGFVVRQNDDSLRFEFSRMIYHPDLADDEKHYIDVLDEIDKTIESYIVEYPEQWFWVHKRWKHGFNMFAND